MNNRLHALGFVLTPYLHSVKLMFGGLCMKETRDFIDAHFASNPNICRREMITGWTTSLTSGKSSTVMARCVRHTCTHRSSPTSRWRRFVLMSGDLLEIAGCSHGFRARIGIVLSK
jgi:hypothetical protein